MTTRERMFLTPWEKFVKYGVVPWKLILHVLLVILVTTQASVSGTREALSAGRWRRDVVFVRGSARFTHVASCSAPASCTAS